MQIKKSQTNARRHPYQFYKDSGVEWLGKIPSHWKMTKLKFVVNKIGSGKTPKGGNETYSNTGIIFIRSQNVHFDGLRLDDVVYIDIETDQEMRSTRVQPQDVLLNITGASLGRATIVPEKFPLANVNQHVAIIRPIKAKIYPAFLKLIFNSNAVQSQIFSTENGAAREGLPYSKTANLVFAMPFEIKEQKAIADFLDRETARIDALIAKYQRLIELLEEKRNSLITHAVTKGLDLSAELTNSGISWLGNIPKYWKTKKIKDVSKIMRGKFGHRPRNDPMFYDGKYPFIQTGDVASASRYITKFNQTLNEMGFKVSAEFPAGTLVMTIAANIGDVAILQFNACFPDSIVGIIPNNEIFLDYLFYLMKSLKPTLTGLAVQNTQLNLNVERISSVSIPIPPKEEQIYISLYLDQRLDEINHLVEKIKEVIIKLQEKRISLIFEAVTGKINLL